MNLFRNYKRPFDRSTLRQEISLITIFFQGRNGDPQSFQRLQLWNYVLFPPLTILNTPQLFDLDLTLSTITKYVSSSFEDWLIESFSHKLYLYSISFKMSLRITDS